METEPNSNTCCTQTVTLTMDVIFEILLHLPAKPLARFKSVSKPFKSLITSRHFILSHIHLHSLTLSVSSHHLSLLSNSTLHTLQHLSTPTRITPIPLPFSLSSQDADLIGSCHGILALSNFPSSLSLFNPTNKTYHIIPFPPLPDPKPESHWVDFGFGHDPLSDTYKLLRLDQLNAKSKSPDSRPRHVSIYTTHSNINNPPHQWRRVAQNFPHFLTHPHGHGKFVKDSLFWMASMNPPAIYDLDGRMRKRGLSDNTVYKYLIVKFHLGEEKFTVVEMPVYGKRKKLLPKPEVAVLGGKLAVQIEHGPAEGRMVEVWVMKAQEWVKFFNFNYQEARPKSVRVKLVAMVGESVLVEMSRKYLWYNVSDGSVKDLVIVDGKLPERFAWFGGHPCDFGAVEYVESLVSFDNSGMEYVDAEDGNGGNGNGGRIRGRSANYITSGRGWFGRGRYYVPIVGYQGR